MVLGIWFQTDESPTNEAEDLVVEGLNAFREFKKFFF